MVHLQTDGATAAVPVVCSGTFHARSIRLRAAPRRNLVPGSALAAPKAAHAACDTRNVEHNVVTHSAGPTDENADVGAGRPARNAGFSACASNLSGLGLEASVRG
jgi:hypothetical protein